MWYVDPKEQVVRVYNSEDNCRTLTEDDFLDGGSVLPGFQLSVRQLFEARLGALSSRERRAMMRDGAEVVAAMLGGSAPARERC